VAISMPISGRYSLNSATSIDRFVLSKSQILQVEKLSHSSTCMELRELDCYKASG
jgi:hypothetical protein